MTRFSHEQMDAGRERDSRFQEERGEQRPEHQDGHLEEKIHDSPQDAADQGIRDTGRGAEQRRCPEFPEINGDEHDAEDDGGDGARLLHGEGLLEEDQRKRDRGYRRAFRDGADHSHFSRLDALQVKRQRDVAEDGDEQHDERVLCRERDTLEKQEGDEEQEAAHQHSPVKDSPHRADPLRGHLGDGVAQPIPYHGQQPEQDAGGERHAGTDAPGFIKVVRPSVFSVQYWRRRKHQPEPF